MNDDFTASGDSVPEFYYPDDHERYFVNDIGYGTCPECGCGLEMWGVVIDGDGSIGDELGCPLCQEMRGVINQIWLDDDEWGNEA